MADPNIKQTGRYGTIAQRLRDDGTETSLLIDVREGNEIDDEAGTLEINTGESAEWCSYTGTTTGSTTNGVTRQTVNGLQRGLKQDATSSSDTDSTIKKNHATGTAFKVVLHSYELNEFAQVGKDNTFSGDNVFTGTSIYTSTTKTGQVIQNVTTAQRDAMTGVANGAQIYNTTLGQMQWYEGGTWVTNDAGGSVVNAADGTAGVLDSATAAEIIANTTSDATSGALNAITVSNVVISSSGAGDSGYIPGLGTDGKLATGFIPNISSTTYSMTALEGVSIGDVVSINDIPTVTAFKDDLASNGGTTGSISAIEIADDIFLVTEDVGSTGEIQAIKYTGSTKTWSQGTAATIKSATDTAFHSIAKIGTNKFVVAYVDTSGTTVYTRVGTVDTGTLAITMGTEEAHNSTTSATLGIGVCALDTDKYAVAYTDATGASIEMRVCTVSGTTITEGVETEVKAAVSTGFGVTILQTGIDKGVVIYGHNSDTTSAAAFTVSGTTPTLGSEVDLHDQDESYASCAFASPYSADGTEDQFALVINKSASSDYTVFGSISTISGTTITVGEKGFIMNDTESTGMGYTMILVPHGVGMYTLFTGKTSGDYTDLHQIRNLGVEFGRMFDTGLCVSYPEPEGSGAGNQAAALTSDGRIGLFQLGGASALKGMIIVVAGGAARFIPNITKKSVTSIDTTASPFSATATDYIAGFTYLGRQDRNNSGSEYEEVYASVFQGTGGTEYLSIASHEYDTELDQWTTTEIDQVVASKVTRFNAIKSFDKNYKRWAGVYELDSDNKPYIVLGTYSTGMTVGTPVNIENAAVVSTDHSQIALCPLNNKKVLTVVSTASGHRARVHLLSTGANTTISSTGTVETLDTDTTEGNVFATQIAEDKAFVIYYNGTSWVGEVLTVSGTTITSNTPVSISSAVTNLLGNGNIHGSVLTSPFETGGSENIAYLYAGNDIARFDISGTTPTETYHDDFFTDVSFSSNSAFAIKCIGDNDVVIYGENDVPQANDNMLLQVHYDGKRFNPMGTHKNFGTVTDATHDQGLALSESGHINVFSNDTIYTFKPTGKPMGIAKANADPGDSVDILISGMVSGIENTIAGNAYVQFCGVRKHGDQGIQIGHYNAPGTLIFQP